MHIIIYKCVLRMYMLCCFINVILHVYTCLANQIKIKGFGI